ncbi:glycoside hydrolase family 5 protein [Fusibacter bizertensis]
MKYIEIKDGKLYREGKPYLLKGFGLGGWLLPEGYMWGLYNKCDRPRVMEKMIETLCGAEYATNFWETYFSAYITREDIKLIADYGFNSVRLPINARHLYTRDENGLILNDKTIRYIDDLITWCKAFDVYVILDMHGAPGGQTGTNIDDSLDDQPSLFIDPVHEQELIALWGMLASRYKDEQAVAAYDLLNEPLPNWFSQYNHKLMPLYQKITAEIRKNDTKHLIVLEGLHWATDFSVFDQMDSEEASDGIVLEFHKYWSNPDEESLASFIEASKRLQAPLFMGEGGENNLDWYTMLFPLYERLNISWSFWSYKKMNCENSPMTFDTPYGWEKIIAWAEQNEAFLKNNGEVQNQSLATDEAQAIFDAFLFNLSHAKTNTRVYNALNRTTPFQMPAEAYDDYRVQRGKKRVLGAEVRMTDPINILFESGRTGAVDYKRYDGAPQPLEENLMVELNENELLIYNFNTDEDNVEVIITFVKNQKNDSEKEKIMTCRIDDLTIKCFANGQSEFRFTFKRKPCALYGEKYNSAHQLIIKCESGILLLDNIKFKRGM